MKKLILCAGVLCLLASCGGKKADTTASSLHPSQFTGMAQGDSLALYVLKNASGMEACITNYGGHVVSLMVPDKNGKPTDVLLGYDKVADYMAPGANNFGALIGRYGNRIDSSRFTLDSVTYKLAPNDGVNCLHGGPKGFDTRVWKAKQIDGQTLQLTYRSPDGEDGFPGNLDVKVIYKVTDDNALDIRYEAVTDKPTVVNLTNHSYFNLSGKPGSQILDHLVQINADSFTVVGPGLIPTGEIRAVAGTPLDFRKPVAVGTHINDNYDQLKLGGGYDLNWVLNTGGDISKVAARVTSPATGITLEVYTSEPGIQFYTGNAMTGKDVGKGGVTYPHHGALCLEAQHYPDSPNHPNFPSTVLRPGQTYHSECIYKFTR
ncbi:MAG: galactose mutarotase [Tannerella sp.]|nr:galactose mutarotase [Tannerella sp.]